MKNKKFLSSFGSWLFENKVLVLFAVLCIFCIGYSGVDVSYVSGELFTRLGRNACLVLSLIIPVLAGLGLNFGIVVGAMASQIAIFWVVHWGFTGIEALLLTALIATPLAIIFGILVGLLYNKTKGSEMITGLVIGYFADGLYKLFVLYIIGGLIPFDDPNLLPRGFGLRNAFDLSNSLKYSLDDISLLQTVMFAAVIFFVWQLALMIYKTIKKQDLNKTKSIVTMIISAILFAVSFLVQYVVTTLETAIANGTGVPAFVNTLAPAAYKLDSLFGQTRVLLSNAIVLIGVVAIIVFAVKLILAVTKKQSFVRPLAGIIATALIVGLAQIPAVDKIATSVRLPACTYAIIFVFCSINNWLLSTKLGQDMRTVGQNRAVATSAGINVNRTRIIATCISTVLAAWGQLIFLQNLGTFNTIQQQTNVGLYSVAALLVGGASVQKSSNKHAILGVILFHTLFVVAPLAATKLVGDSAISEYIRMFISYGVIAAALAMHAWKTVKKNFQAEKKK